MGRAAVEAGLRVQAVVPVGAEAAADRVRRLLALRELAKGIDGVQVIAVDRPGQPVASGPNTAVDHLRATALTRLVLDGVRVLASPDTEGLGMAQGSLRMGCSDFGVVFVDGAAESWSATVDEIERCIYAAGFEPVGVQTVRAPDLGTDGVAATP